MHIFFIDEEKWENVKLIRFFLSTVLKRLTRGEKV